MANRVLLTVCGVIVIAGGGIWLFVIPGIEEKIFSIVSMLTGTIILLYGSKVKLKGEPLKSHILYFAFAAMPLCKALITIYKTSVNHLPFLLAPVLIHGGLAVLIIAAGIWKLKESQKSGNNYLISAQCSYIVICIYNRFPILILV